MSSQSEWRVLSTREEETLTKLYMDGRKSIAWFFYIWYAIGIYLILAGTVSTIRYIVNGELPMYGIIIIPVLILFAGGAFIAFPHWILDTLCMREIKAIKAKTARVCEVPLLNKREKKTRKERHTKTTYIFTVCLPNNEQAEVEGGKYLYENTQEGESILIFANDKFSVMYHAYPIGLTHYI